ncbi:MAG TPA: hypothetical protein VHK02_14870 [Actinomycetota bacterium]|jgi:hypothetical protein|nr:hypothetical protein [Actinomycetota bacterium]
MTAVEVETQRTHDVQRDQHTGRMLPTAVAVAGLWLATALSSMFAPDLVSAAQDRVPIVAITIWIWGAVATGFVLFGAAFPARDRMARWGLPVAVLGIWGAVALVSIYAPTIVSGDGTIVPVAGLFAPVAGAIATGYACLGAAWAAVSERRLS